MIQLLTGDDAMNVYGFNFVVAFIPTDDSIPIDYLAGFKDEKEANDWLAYAKGIHVT